MSGNVLINNKNVVSFGTFFLHYSEKSATIVLEDASFTLHLYDPSKGESPPEFSVDENSGACAVTQKYFANLQFGEGGKYFIRLYVDPVHSSQTGLCMVHYSVHLR